PVALERPRQKVCTPNKVCLIPLHNQRARGQIVKPSQVCAPCCRWRGTFGVHSRVHCCDTVPDVLRKGIGVEPSSLEKRVALSLTCGTWPMSCGKGGRL